MTSSEESAPSWYTVVRFGGLEVQAAVDQLDCNLKSNCSLFFKILHITNSTFKLKNCSSFVGELTHQTCFICFAELHVPLQRRHLGHRSGPAEAPAGPQGLHAAYGALHRQDHGAGQELRAADHRQTHLYSVKNIIHVLIAAAGKQLFPPLPPPAEIAHLTPFLFFFL